MSRVLVIGAAMSGLAAADLARRSGDTVVVYDAKPEAVTRAASSGVATAGGEWDHLLLTGVDLVVVSPGVPEKAAPITDALEAGIPVVSEIEYAWRSLASQRLVAVTGTNGKTTVTGLVSRMLMASGFEAPAVGNIGVALSGLAPAGTEVIPVVEASSFQLRFIDRFHADVAVITNVAEDHLDWHGTVAAYIDAKARIVENQTEHDVVVFAADDEGAARVASRTRGRRHPVAVGWVPDDGSGFTDSEVVWRNGVTMPRSELSVHDDIFTFDVVVAAAAAMELGADPDPVLAVARRFAPSSHRRQFVADIGGVAYVDDSKATNPHAALASIRSFPQVVLIAGGIAKHLDVSPLATEPTVRFTVAIGESAPVLLAAAGDRGRPARSMEEAVATAASLAEPGDTVLLAPGCSSFDMFDDYAARGDAFAAAVRSMSEVKIP